MPNCASPESTVQLYIDGVRTGNREALETAFHADARMFGALAGQRVDVAVSELVAMVAAQPADVDGTFKATIRSIETHGDVAVAVVDEENFWGAVGFTDIFTLSLLEGSWQIVSKTFHHTGGLPPGA